MAQPVSNICKYINNSSFPISTYKHLHFNHNPRMQLGTSYKANTGRSPLSTVDGGRAPVDLKRVVEESAVVVFAQKDCCMSFVVRRILQSVGANPVVYEVERDTDCITGEVADGGVLPIKLPAVFIGGRWFGGPERVIATLIAEELSLVLKEAGALWL